ncbi:MAG TPA: ABC transporter permease [Acidimicrobiales bacterium]|nr:ABC transporter permease [Acidimicrobiales bacterium]
MTTGTGVSGVAAAAGVTEIGVPSELPELGTPSLGQRARWLVSDSLVITKRNLLVWFRVPAFIVFTLVQPVMFTLLFRYVFGGAIKTHGIPYVDYLIPGVIAQTAGFTSFSTAIGLAREIQRGGIDRIRSMPSARSAFLIGRLTADVLRLTLTIVVMVGVGYAVGFRFEAGPVDAVAMVAISALLGLAVCCVSACIGLGVKDEESVQAFGLIWVFPLTFVSSAFVQVSTMPSWLQGFANHQPFTEVIDVLRWLALGHNAGFVVHQSLSSSLWQALAWMVGTIVVFVPLATRAYKRA